MHYTQQNAFLQARLAGNLWNYLSVKVTHCLISIFAKCCITLCKIFFASLDKLVITRTTADENIDHEFVVFELAHKSNYVL